jgi:hypothetical protein
MMTTAETRELGASLLAHLSPPEEGTDAPARKTTAKKVLAKKTSAKKAVAKKLSSKRS